MTSPNPKAGEPVEELAEAIKTTVLTHFGGTKTVHIGQRYEQLKGAYTPDQWPAVWKSIAEDVLARIDIAAWNRRTPDGAEVRDPTTGEEWKPMVVNLCPSNVFALEIAADELEENGFDALVTELRQISDSISAGRTPPEQGERDGD